ncbi:MAG: formate dehydrogenase subunit gamma [Oceanospirillaceae bacterium]
MDATSVSANEKIQKIITELRDKPGALLPILHEVQHSFGYIPPNAIPLIAAALQQTAAEIHGVISFYRHFHTSKAGSNRVEICRAEACQARGGRALESHAKESLNVDYHQTTADRNITLDPVYCLGNCACGPNIRIGDDIVGRVTPEKFDKVINGLNTVALQIT